MSFIDHLQTYSKCLACTQNRLTLTHVRLLCLKCQNSTTWGLLLYLGPIYLYTRPFDLGPILLYTRPFDASNQNSTTWGPFLYLRPIYLYIRPIDLESIYLYTRPIDASNVKPLQVMAHRSSCSPLLIYKTNRYRNLLYID